MLSDALSTRGPTVRRADNASDNARPGPWPPGCGGVWRAPKAPTTSDSASTTRPTTPAAGAGVRRRVRPRVDNASTTRPTTLPRVPRRGAAHPGGRLVTHFSLPNAFCFLETARPRSPSRLRGGPRSRAPAAPRGCLSRRTCRTAPKPGRRQVCGRVVGRVVDNMTSDGASDSASTARPTTPAAGAVWVHEFSNFQIPRNCRETSPARTRSPRRPPRGRPREKLEDRPPPHLRPAEALRQRVDALSDVLRTCRHENPCNLIQRGPRSVVGSPGFGARGPGFEPGRQTFGRRAFCCPRASDGARAGGASPHGSLMERLSAEVPRTERASLRRP